MNRAASKPPARVCRLSSHSSPDTGRFALERRERAECGILTADIGL